MAELVLAGLLLFVDAAWPSWVALGAFVVFTVVLVRRLIERDRRPCNCFGAASRQARAVRWVACCATRGSWCSRCSPTGAATMHEPSAVLATLLVGVGLAAVSAVLVVRT